MRNYFLIATMAAILIPASSQAGAIITLPSVSANAGDVNDSFDVLLVYSGVPISAAGFAFEITTSDPDITFTDATTGTSTGYIFAGSSVFGPDIVTTPPGQTLDASDIGGATLVTGSYGLGHVFYAVAANATPGTFAITLTVNGTSMSDPNATPISVSLSNGSITISSVPEPSSLALVFSAICGIAALRFGIERSRS